MFLVRFGAQRRNFFGCSADILTEICFNFGHRILLLAHETPPDTLVGPPFWRICLFWEIFYPASFAKASSKANFRKIFIDYLGKTLFHNVQLP